MASSPTQSLVPAPDFDYTGRRTLLLVYVHGFMGDETSFQSFPAHLHNLLTITMADSHAVHTKIYPKYRSRNSLMVARDDFSQWLTPNETPWSDVILLGHSMGGLLAADIALLARHNILGVVNFDVPFLGMHPGIVKAGLGSIFNPWPGPESPTSEEPEGKRPSRISTLFNPTPSDPNYNPAFDNDVHLPTRKGWENALHFINKHSNGLISAGKTLVKSHLQFGGAMADYRELKARYARIRALEQDSEEKRKSANPEIRHPPRIRFVNYYTASSGRPKTPKSPKSPSPKSPSPVRPTSRGLEQSTGNISASTSNSQLVLTDIEPIPTTISPRISVEEHRGDKFIPVTPQEPLSATSPPEPITSLPSNPGSSPDLPEIPPIPPEPPFVDLALYPNKAERKVAEKEHSRALKDYQRAVKARNAVINERSKLYEKWQSQNQAQVNSTPKTDKADSTHESDNNVEEEFGATQLNTQVQPGGTGSTNPYGHYEFSQSTILAQPHPDDRSTTNGSSINTSYADSTHTLATENTNDTTTHDPSQQHPPKKKRLKKFCMLPPKDANGNKDPTWIRVFMENMDEVAAHTSLFFMSETYERLVGDVGARVEDWVRENESLRLVREMEALNY